MSILDILAHLHVLLICLPENIWEYHHPQVRLVWCGLQVPRVQRVVETYSCTTYGLDADAVKGHFMSLVDNAVAITERSLSAYVREFVRRQVEVARTRVKSYGEG